jgi:putative transposase
MTNHYHLIVQTPEANLAEGMHFLQSAHANRFNHTREHSGHVFQGRYGARVIQSTSDLRHVARYVLLNPVEAGLCGRVAVVKPACHPGTLRRAAIPSRGVCPRRARRVREA